MFTPNAKPFVSIVIPHRGDDTSLERCLEGLRQQTYPHRLFEILIILNERHYRPLECALREGESKLWEPHYFSYSARNLGVKNAKGDVVAFTDSDTIPWADWIAEGVAAMAEVQSDLVAGHITVTVTEGRPSLPALYELMYAFDQERNARGGFSATANLFVARHLFAERGLFDPFAITGQDFEWTRGAVGGGAKLIYAPLAVVDHPARESWSALLAKARRTSRAFADTATAPHENVGRLNTRFRFQMATKPSSSKVRPLTPPQRFAARLVRAFLLAYKALCLLPILASLRKRPSGSQVARAQQKLPTQVGDA